MFDLGRKYQVDVRQRDPDAPRTPFPMSLEVHLERGRHLEAGPDERSGRPFRVRRSGPWIVPPRSPGGRLHDRQLGPRRRPSRRAAAPAAVTRPETADPGSDGGRGGRPAQPRERPGRNLGAVGTLHEQRVGSAHGRPPGRGDSGDPEPRSGGGFRPSPRRPAKAARSSCLETRDDSFHCVLTSKSGTDLARTVVLSKVL